MARADFLRKNAEDCFARAQKASSDEARTSWLSMAQHWLQMARKAETGASGRHSPPRPQDLRQDHANG